MNWLLGFAAKLITGLFGEWRRDMANRKLGAADLRASTAEATLENIKRMGAIPRTGRADAVGRLRDNGL